MTKYHLGADGEVRPYTSKEEAEAAALALADARAIAASAFKAEGLRRVGQAMSAWGDERTIRFLAATWNMLDGAAATAAQILAKDVYVFWNRRRGEIDTMTAAQLEAFDPTAADPFGDGDGWPAAA